MANDFSDLPTIDSSGGFGAGSAIGDRYVLKEPIGAGGFADVYRAHDSVLNRDLAIKVLKDVAPGRQEDDLSSFLAEAHTIARLDHPNVVPVYDAGIEKGSPWIAMKLVRGQSLAHTLERDGKLPFLQVIPLLSQAAGALDHAHRHGVIHRDIKPSNILVEKDDSGRDHLWLADFGIAQVLTGKTIAGNQLKGTPSYMAPEQIAGNNVDARADIFAIGCVACELVTGIRCFSGETYSQVLYRVVHEPPQGLAEASALASDEFKAFVCQATAKEPSDRFQTANEMIGALDRLSHPPPARTATRFRRGLAKMLRKPTPPVWDGRYVIEISDLHKSYTLKTKVLNGLNLKIPSGSIFGLLGRNGCGKTTLMKILTGFLGPDIGEALLLGMSHRWNGPEILSRLAYVPETFCGYDGMKVSELLQFLPSFYPKWDRSRCYKLLERFELPLNAKLGNLSKGMKTKASLVSALSHRPQLLVLDDPTLGLDAVVLQEVFETVYEMSQEDGTTVFVATHNVEELEKIATHIAVIADGRALVSDTLAALKTRTRQVTLTFKDEAPKPAPIEQFKPVRASGRRLVGVVFDTTSGAMEKLKALRPEQIEVRELGLKEIFVSLTKSGDA